MYYIVSEICIGCIGRCFLEDCFYRYCQQIISAVANESLIPYNLIKRRPETQITFNTVTSNVNPNQIKKDVKYCSVFRTVDLVPYKYKQ